jgi:hypothetical protein
MRYVYSILCLLICVIGNTHAKGQTHALSLDYPSWSASVRTLKERGYRKNNAEPLSQLESKASPKTQDRSKRLNKVMAFGRNTKSKGILAHRTALFFERKFVKFNHVVVFSKAQLSQVADMVRTIEVAQSGAPGVLCEAIDRGESVKWTFPMKQSSLRVSIYIDEEGGVIKIEKSALGLEETLEQYRRHLVARMSQGSAG